MANEESPEIVGSVISCRTQWLVTSSGVRQRAIEMRKELMGYARVCVVGKWECV